jgi:hypothetical protein
MYDVFLIIISCLDEETSAKQIKKLAKLEKENHAMKIKLAKAKGNALNPHDPTHVHKCRLSSGSSSAARGHNGSDSDNDVESEDEPGSEIPSTFSSSVCLLRYDVDLLFIDNIT